MKNDPVPTPGEIWKILKNVSLGHDRLERLIEKERRENDRRKAENDRRAAENDRRAAENDRKIEENDRLIEKIRQETDRKIQENDRKIEENDRQAAERKAETDRKIQENDRLIKKIEGRFGTQWGELIEALIEGSLVEVLNERGIRVNRAVPNYTGRRAGKKKEFDVIALNGHEMAVIETKSQLSRKKADEFLDVMRVFKEYCPEYGALKVYGGVACLKGREEVFSYAESLGLFVLRVSGKNAVLLNRKKFKPKVF